MVGDYACGGSVEKQARRWESARPDMNSKTLGDSSVVELIDEVSAVVVVHLIRRRRLEELRTSKRYGARIAHTLPKVECIGN
jgi:hypothetical protein